MVPRNHSAGLVFLIFHLKHHHVANINIDGRGGIVRNSSQGLYHAHSLSDSFISSSCYNLDCSITMASRGNQRKFRKIYEFFSKADSQSITTISSDEDKHSESIEMRSLSCDADKVYMQSEAADERSASAAGCEPCNFQPAYPDMQRLSERELQKDEIRVKCLQGEWEDSHKYTFPATVIRSKQRKFNHTWLESYKWLRYSVATDTVCCVYCVLFGQF